MNTDAIIWAIFNIVSIAILGFYSMMEMACVSFNKVRLQYYVANGNKRACQLNDLLHTPARFFGTTLIGVNIALVIGAECSRQFYTSIGWDPDFAPLVQVILVVIFGELAPMFAARKYAEHMAMLGIPVIYASAKLMQPLLWLVNCITSYLNKLIGLQQQSELNIYLTQEELQKLLEEQTEDSYRENEFSTISTNVFNLKRKTISQVMNPTGGAVTLPSNATVNQMRTACSLTGADYILLYDHTITKIVAIAYPRDVIRASGHHRVREYSKAPWFVPETITIMQVLKQFRTNHESVAIILNKTGSAIGFITLDDILEEIFGKTAHPITVPARHQNKLILIDKSFPLAMTQKEFKAQYGMLFDPNQDLDATLIDLMTNALDHRPKVGDAIYIAPFEITLITPKMINVLTKLH